MKRPCLVCRRLTEGSYCRAHRPVKPPSPSSRAWRKPGAAALRQRVLDRDGRRCTFCGTTKGLEVHHIVPVAKGGTNDPSNLITVCRAHHPHD